MAKERTALVTGGSGFIGGHLVSSLLKKNWKVRCLLRKSSSRQFLDLKQIEVVEGDLSDKNSLRHSLKGINRIFHLAGVIKGKTREDFFSINWRGTKNLLEVARESARPLKKFLYISSLSAAGPSPDGHLLKEEETPRPVSYYGESKLAGEREVLSFSSHFPVAVIRPAVVYGPREREVFQIIRMVQHGFKLRLGGQESFFSAVHVSDLVRAILLTADNPSADPKIYFISDGQAHSWQKGLDTVGKILGNPSITVKLPVSLIRCLVKGLSASKVNSSLSFYQDKIKELAHRYWICDISRARNELGFKPHFDFPGGMEHTISWYRKQGWL